LILCLGIRVCSKNSVLILFFSCFVYAIDRVARVKRREGEPVVHEGQCSIFLLQKFRAKRNLKRRKLAVWGLLGIKILSSEFLEVPVPNLDAS